jgi:uncharacterized membrane protein YeaQ/YmgE (transglycosylase-associated protein family)
VGFIALLVIGLVVGALARAVLPGRQALPIWATMLIGVVALLVAGLIFSSFLLKVIVGVVVAAAVIALIQGGVRSGSTSRV